MVILNIVLTWFVLSIVVSVVCGACISRRRPFAPVDTKRLLTTADTVDGMTRQNSRAVA